MSDLSSVVAVLETMGVKHAPMQKCTEPPHDEYGREVTLRDPPGVYYLLGSDTDQPEELIGQIQLIFLEPPFEGDPGVPAALSATAFSNIAPRVAGYAASIGYRVKKLDALVSDKGSIPAAVLIP